MNCHKTLCLCVLFEVRVYEKTPGRGTLTLTYLRPSNTHPLNFLHCMDITGLHACVYSARCLRMRRRQEGILYYHTVCWNANLFFYPDWSSSIPCLKHSPSRILCDLLLAINLPSPCWSNIDTMVVMFWVSVLIRDTHNYVATDKIIY